jgi:uncharacterized protein YukJ
MEQSVPRFQYVLISISDDKLKFKTKLNEIRGEYQHNIYYYGSDAEYAKFQQAFGKVIKIDASLPELVANCQYYYVDHNAIERIEDFVFNSKIIIVE